MIVKEQGIISDRLKRISLEEFAQVLIQNGYHYILVHEPRDVKTLDLDDPDEEVGNISHFWLGETAEGYKIAYFGTPESFKEYQRKDMQ